MTIFAARVAEQLETHNATSVTTAAFFLHTHTTHTPAPPAMSAVSHSDRCGRRCARRQTDSDTPSPSGRGPCFRLRGPSHACDRASGLGRANLYRRLPSR